MRDPLLPTNTWISDEIESPPHNMKLLVSMDGSATGDYAFSKIAPYKKNNHFVLLSGE